MSDYQFKGNQLEKAVQRIEQTILDQNPMLKGVNYSIETKKVEIIDGVKHEIDVFVRFNLGDGYDSVFLFECKNWSRENIGKNEIIIFSEKIKAFNAQRGYFVAKNFGEYAKPQAELDKRLELVYVKDFLEEPFELSPVHTKGCYFVKYIVNFKRRDSLSNGEEDINLELATCIYQGKQIKVKDFAEQESLTLIREKLVIEQAQLERDGRYPLIINRVIKYEGLSFEELDIESVRYQINFTFINDSLPTRVISRFDVIGRGQYLELEVEDPERGWLKIQLSTKE